MTGGLVQPRPMLPVSLNPKLASLLSQEGTTDVLVNGHNEVWVQKSNGQMRSVESPFESEQELAKIARDSIAQAGRHLDQANPFADVSIEGIRVHAALASACTPKTTLSLRVHAKRSFGLAQLCDLGAISETQLDFLRDVIEARESFIISGATGSGKTTLLRAILAECPSDRIIAIEDVSEINLDSGHFVSLQTRQANIEGRGEIGLDRLVRESLRMRPDRIAIGEARGPEFLVMLQALNTGHEGGGVTIHANSILDVPARMQSIGRAGGWSATDIAEAAHSAFRWVIHMKGHRVRAVGQFVLGAGSKLGVVPRDV
ncbi:MAG: hypothetical protein RL085_554 [Actinomycetota bacterium]|jgi:pilus assembly protein CpaF